MKIKWKGIVLLSLIAVTGKAYFEQPTQKVSEMNGIRLSDYKDITLKWHLVTVRYRQDTHEMRVVYANDKAWKEMKKLKPNYPDGAIFAKIGMMTEKDPAFISSEVPSGARRFQLMVRDHKKYKSTQGWGYALFDENGNIFKGKPQDQAAACAACHRIVPERDYVFSRPWQIQFSPSLPGGDEKAAVMQKMIRFEKREPQVYSQKLKKHLTDPLKSIDSLEGEIKKSTFSGTFDEIIPLLIENTKSKGRASIFYMDDKNFSLVTPTKTQESCESGKMAFRIVVVLNGGSVRNSISCQ